MSTFVSEIARTMGNEHWGYYPAIRGFDALADIYPVVEGRGYIAGSYAAYMMSGEGEPYKPNDIDIFATTEANWRDIIDILFRQRDVSYREEREHITLIDRSAAGLLPIQIIAPNPAWKDFPGDILSDFDLDICRAVLVSPTSVIADHNAGNIQGKILRINNPLRTLKRIAKYQARGVSFTDHELLKLFSAWQVMDDERRVKMIEAARLEEIERNTSVMDSDFVDDDDWFEGE
jgi:hypothetical protein